MHDINKLKDLLLFEIQKAFYDERGKGARYRLTTIGVSFFEDKIDKDMNNTESIAHYLKDSRIVGDIECSENTISFNMKISSCCLKEICDRFDATKMQPLSCPIANLVMNALELKSGLSPEMLPIKIEGNTCEITLAEMATSDVVGGEKL